MAPPDSRVEDVHLTLAQDTVVHGWWYPTEDWDGTKPVLLYLHGYSGNLSHRGPAITRWQQELGVAVLIVDYPGFGRSTGRPSEPHCYATADAAYEWLTRDRRVGTARLLLYGGSLGGAVAVDLASRQPHRALILVGAFTSVHEIARKRYPFLPVRWLVPNRFNSLAKIGSCRHPVFFAHGTADRVVPFAHAEKLFAAVPGQKQLFPLVGCDHHHPPGREFFNELRMFLARITGRGA